MCSKMASPNRQNAQKNALNKCEKEEDPERPPKENKPHRLSVNKKKEFHNLPEHLKAKIIFVCEKYNLSVAASTAVLVSNGVNLKKSIKCVEESLCASVPY